MKPKLLLCLALVLSGCTSNKLAYPAPSNSSIIAARPATQTSPWGEAGNGLRCRLTLPETIEQGMDVPATIELQADATNLPAGVRTLSAFMHDDFLKLTLTDLKSGKQFDVNPYSGDWMPLMDNGADLVALNRQPLTPWKTHFPLVMLYSNLAPADYVCQVTFSYPNGSPHWPVRGAAASNPASWWHGTIVSGNVHMRVLPETPKSQVFWIPKRLVVTKEITNLHSADQAPLLAAIPVIRFHKADAQSVKFPVRNGHFLNTEIDRQGLTRFCCGGSALFPDDANPIDGWYDYKGHDIVADYQIEVFETATEDGDPLPMGSGSPGYRLLWSRAFHISMTGKDFQQLPASVLNVPAGADNRDCVALIQANPDVEELSLGNTGITDEGLATIGRLRHLRILYLHDTHITDAGVVYLQNLTRLKLLNLDGTKVTDAGILRLRRLTRLENLYLRNTSITDVGAAIVSRFPHLKQLDLSYTRIGDTTAARLPDLQQIEWLDLTETKVTDKSLPGIIQLVHLNDFRPPPTFGDKDLDAITLALPDCSVAFDNAKP